MISFCVLQGGLLTENPRTVELKVTESSPEREILTGWFVDWVIIAIDHKAHFYCPFNDWLDIDR